MTHKEWKNQRRRQLYQERKQIESILHPPPEINGITIMHEHTSHYIRFTAWKGDAQVNSRVIEYDRGSFVLMPEGYDFYNKELRAHFNYLMGLWPPEKK